MDTSAPHKEIHIRKASGEEEAFDIHKLESSLHNAGADRKSIKKILIDIENWIYHGVTTKKIYSRAFLLLNREKSGSSLRYKLKQAILELGPSGYPFEQFIGELFKRKGYKTEVGVIVQGTCVSHEMDVIATKGSVQHIMECKYHKDQGKSVSVQVPLYVRSRVDDIIRVRMKLPEYHGLSFTGWVVTNTRFSSDSIHYGRCAGLKLLAWDYPRGKGLKDLIEEVKIYPITILTKLTKKEKHSILEKEMVTCAQLQQNLKVLDPLNLNPRKYRELLKELSHICG
jgi:hypothetical protein